MYINDNIQIMDTIILCFYLRCISIYFDDFYENSLVCSSVVVKQEGGDNIGPPGTFFSMYYHKYFLIYLISHFIEFFVIIF